MADECPKPMPGESVREYAERLDEAGVTSVETVMTNFGLELVAAKSLWLANEGFNAKFSYKGWKGRRKNSSDGYGARNWLKRAYRLDDEAADLVVAEIEAGNERALVETMGFEKIVRTRLTDSGQTSLEKLGLLREGNA